MLIHITELLNDSGSHITCYRGNLGRWHGADIVVKAQFKPEIFRPYSNKLHSPFNHNSQKKSLFSKIESEGLWTEKHKAQKVK